MREHSSDSLGKIGERIKALRIKKSMTQSQLTGGEITRNMLSRIENGMALPSLPTLCLLAERLEVPAGALLGDLGDYAGWNLAKELKSLLNNHKYERIIERCTQCEYSEIGEESKEILCVAYIGNSLHLYECGKLTEASEGLDRAEALLTPKLTEGGTADRIFTGKLLIAACSALRQKDSDSPIENRRDELSPVIFKNEEAVYLYCLSSLCGITGSAYSMPHERSSELNAELSVLVCRLTNEVYRAHIEAKLDMMNAEYLDGKAKLVKLLTLAQPLPILYEVYADLEFCCKCCGDFENAYKYSELRLELLKRIS